ncbi:MAG: alpha/beta fold hydrolase [Rhodocyclaceae bacterium]
MLRTTLWILLAVFACYAALVGSIIWRQEKLLFYPTPLPADFQFNKPGVVERKVEVPGATLSALHFRQPESKGLIFFLHGNAGNLDIWLPSTEFYRRAGYDLFMLDYRGFGKSSGKIESEAQLHADVQAAWRSVAGEYKGKPVVIYGRSLGTGLATKLASELPAGDAALLVLVSPYSSFAQLGRDHFAWIPSFLSRYPMRTDLWLPQVKSPVFMVHGDRDVLIAPSHAEALQRLRPDAELLHLPEAGHNDVHEFQAYTDALAARLGRLTAP